jgi:site-specific recombinase XerD
MTAKSITTTEPKALTVITPRPLDQNAAAVYLAGLSAGSRPAMRGALNEIAAMLTKGQVDALALDWAALRFQHTAAIRAKLAKRDAPATVNKKLSALRGVLKVAWRLSQMSAEDYTRAVDIESVTGSRLPAGRALTAGEIAALLDACVNDPTPAGARDGAIIALLRAGGLRRAEVCSLDLADYSAAGSVLTIRGKRNKERELPLSNGALDALADWLTVRGAEAGPLFPAIQKGGRVKTAQRMTPQAINLMLAKRAALAGVADLSPHDLRRTFVSDLLDAGADISTVQKLAGHSNVQTTARYDRRGEQAKREAVDLLHVPYHKRGK